MTRASPAFSWQSNVHAAVRQEVAGHPRWCQCRTPAEHDVLLARLRNLNHGRSSRVTADHSEIPTRVPRIYKQLRL